MGRLGCGVNRAYITGRCGTPRTCDLSEQASDITYDRRLDEVSEATIVIPISGMPDDACCGCLADVEPWCHELQIARDDEVVWIGPVTQVLYGFNTVTIHAKDLSYWMRKRIPEVATPATSTQYLNLSTIAQEILNEAYAEDDPCVLANVIASTTTLFKDGRANDGFGSRDYPPYVSNALDYWLNLAQSGLDFTVINRSIIYGDILAANRPIGLLTSDLVLGDITFTKDGEQAANRWFINWAEPGCQPPAAGCPGIKDAASQHCYGLLEDEKSFTEITNGQDANDTAEAYINATQIVPRTLSFPSGSRLSPETPWELSDMIPGCRLDVGVSNLCAPLDQSFRLQTVVVHQSGNGEEEIKLSASPLSTGQGTI